MTGAEPNKSGKNSGYPLSVFAAEEINFPGLPAFEENFSDLSCMVSVNIYKLLESCLFLVHDFPFSPIHDKPKQLSPPRAQEAPCKPRVGTSLSREGCGRKLQGMLPQFGLLLDPFGNLFSIPCALSPGNTWTCFRSSGPGKFPGNASLSTGTASVLGDSVPNSMKRHQEVGAGEPGSSSCPGQYQTPCPHSCSAPPQHTRVGLGQTLRRVLIRVEPSCSRDLRDHLRPPVVQRCPTEKRDKPG